MVVEVLIMKRIKSSAYGNPRWGLTVKLADGKVCEMRTGVDAAVGYYLTGVEKRLKISGKVIRGYFNIIQAERV